MTEPKPGFWSVAHTAAKRMSLLAWIALLAAIVVALWVLVDGGGLELIGALVGATP